MDLYPLTEEAQAALAELREMINAAPVEDQAFLKDPKNDVQLQESDLLRYIKARKFVVADAYEQLIETLRWRNTAFDQGIDQLFPNLVDPNEEFFQINCPHAYMGHDKEGRPISWERTGVYDLPSMLEVVGKEGLLKRRVYHQELMANKMRLKSEESGNLVTQQMWVLDLRNLSLKVWKFLLRFLLLLLLLYLISSLQPSGEGPNMFKETIKLDSTYFPERLGTMYIINAPWIFKLSFLLFFRHFSSSCFLIMSL